MTTRPADSMIDVAALRGLLQLGVSGTVGVASLAQAIHEAVIATSPLPWMPASALVNGVARLAYGSVRGVAGAVGKGGDSLLSLAERRIGGERRLSKRREFAVPLGFRSALNGVVGDRLEALANPMALPMTIEAHRWSRSGVHRAARGPRVLFIHGLCMTDEHWQAPTARGEDFGDRLARESGLRPLYLRYNTGLAIAENGRRLAALLEIRHRGRRAWQEPFHVVAHSLGGLVLRSAIAEGLSQGHVWTERLQHVVSLGTPHDGAPLERLGKSVEAALRLSRFSSPWAVLASVRSVAIQQLGHAAVAPWPSVPPSLRWHAVAGALGSRDRGRLGAFLGDGLVPVASALGQHREGSAPEFAERTVLQGVGHLALVRHPSVAHLLIRRMT
jgi:pimeloyl-ACP methyl ester carboxylesterase